MKSTAPKALPLAFALLLFVTPSGWCFYHHTGAGSAASGGSASGSGPVYLSYRFYNPSTGRWLSRDPAGDARDHNLLAFTRNNPVGGIDRLGLKFVHDVVLLPRQFGANIAPDGSTTARLLSLSSRTVPCSCGIVMNDYELHATVLEQFRWSESQARQNGDIDHEDAHARSAKVYYETISDGARVIYMRCVSLPCYFAWAYWWAELGVYADAQLTLTTHQIDFNDPGYDPARRPTQAQLDADAASLADAQSRLRALVILMILQCAK